MSQAIKVGLFALVVLVVLGALVLKIEDVPLFGGPDSSLTAIFDSVAGLDDKASVRIAGVRVGRVDGIGLENRKARVRLALDTPVALTEGTFARIANLGLLGEKYVELVPGPDGEALLAEGAVIPGVTPPTFDDALAKLNDIGDTFSEGMGGIGGDGAIARLVSNLEEVSADIRDLVRANRGQVDATMENVASLTGTLRRDMPAISSQVAAVLDRMDRTLAQLEGAMGESRPDLQATAANLRRLTDEARTSVDNLNEVTGRLARGEGTIGKLLTSDEAHDELVGALESVQSGVESLSGALGGVQKIQLELGLESYYLQDLEESRSSFNLDIDPQSGKLYRVAVVDSPFGKERTRTREETITDPDGTTATTTTRTVTRENTPVYSALFGYPFESGPRVWAGLIESSGGVQIEYPLLDRRFWLSLEAFEFDREDDLEPHLRLSGIYRLNDNLYLRAGYDDFLTDERDSLFLGGGIRWRDDQLKYLLGSVSKF